MTMSLMVNQSTCSDNIFTINTYKEGMNQRLRQEVENVFYTGLGSVECLVGIPTNIINCLVFRGLGLGDRMNLSLFSLAVTHCSYFVIMFVVFPLASFIRFNDVALYEEYFYNVGIALLGVLRGLTLTSGCINMAVAVDTCVCVVFPHRAASIMRTKTMMLFIVSCFLIIQILNILFPLSYSVVKLTAGQQQRWAVVCTIFYQDNQLFIYLFQNIFLETLVPFVTVTVVLVATIVTVKTLTSALSWREHNGQIVHNLRNRQVALTKNLTIVASVFVIVMLPSVAFQISHWFVIHLLDESQVREQFVATGAVIFVISQVHGCLNFFVYCHRSSRFLGELHRIFRRSAARNEMSETDTGLQRDMNPQSLHSIHA